MKGTMRDVVKFRYDDGSIADTAINSTCSQTGEDTGRCQLSVTVPQ